MRESPRSIHHPPVPTTLNIVLLDRMKRQRATVVKRQLNGKTKLTTRHHNGVTIPICVARF